MTHTLESGAILEGRYEIQHRLGQGGMGAVYLARDTRLDVRCAVKETFYTTPEALDQFEREARLLAKLKHPHLPHVTDYFDEQGRYYLVMEYISGKDLARWRVQRGAPSNRQVTMWACQLLDALNYLHRRRPPVIHRDIKPENIKLTPEGQAVLVDFGIAKIFDPSGMTTTGAKAISPGYSPPEQYSQAQRTDARSDIYGLGATFYYVLTGRCPPEAVERFAGENLPPLSHFCRVDPKLERVILRAMAMDPRRRWPDASAMRAALEQLTLLPLEDDLGAPAEAEPALKLVLQDGREYPLRPGGTLRLGRAADNDIVLREEQVSRYHAEIRTDPRGSAIIDLASTNKTFLDGRRLTPHKPYPAAMGARVRMGEHVVFDIERGEVAREADDALSPETNIRAELRTVAPEPRDQERAREADRRPIAPPSPPVTSEPRGSSSSSGIPPRFLAMGAAAALVLVAMIVGSALLLGRDPTPDETPLPGEPTFTPTVEEIIAADPTSTPAGGGVEEEGMQPTSTVAPGYPTSTPRPEPSATPTPEPTPAPACVRAAPQLVEPADESSHYSGMEIEFVWEGGNLCEGERWRVGIFGHGLERYCEAAPGQTRVSCQVNADPGEYDWRVEGVRPDGSVIQGTQSSGRVLYINPPPGGGGGGSSSTCPDKPTQPCQDRTQEWVCEDGEWVCK